MKKYALFLVLFLASSNTVYAISGFYSSSSLLERCEEHISRSSTLGNVCPGYIMGIADLHEVLVAWGVMSPQWCIPSDVGLVQLMQVVQKRLAGHPEDLHLGAGIIVADAFLLAFPCG